MENLSEPRTDVAGAPVQCVVTDAVLRDVRELFESEFGGRDPFPGAVDRAGTRLVRLGLAKNLGRHTYGGGSYGERPDVWTRFELTPEGKRLIDSHGRSR